MDAIFKAMNDATRRTILDTLRDKDGQTLSDLEDGLDMTRFGVMKHLKVLEDASLITTVKRGRFKHHYLNVIPLQEVIDRWIDPLLAKPAARGVLDFKRRLEGTAPMLDEQEKPDFVMQTYIRCTQDALWSALTDPDEIVHYHFMANRAEGKLEDGGSQTYFVPGGHPMLTMTVTRADPKTRIEFTFEPSWEGPGMPTSRCVYIVAVEGEHCRLTVEHYDIPEGQEGAADGWARMLSGLKTYLETGKAAKFGGGMGQ